MKKYFVYDGYENDTEFFDTEKEASEYAEKILQEYRDDSIDDGWCEDFSDGLICYGKVMAGTEETDTPYRGCTEYGFKKI